MDHALPTRALRVDLVNGGLLILAKRSVLAVAHDADDLCGVAGLGRARQANARADRIHILEVPPREFFVDDDDNRRAALVLDAEIAPFHQADP